VVLLNRPADPIFRKASKGPSRDDAAEN